MSVRMTERSQSSAANNSGGSERVASGGGLVGSSVSNATVEDGGGPVIPAGVAEALVAAARDQGVALTGPGGLLTG
jgi:hypothetical protein